MTRAPLLAGASTRSTRSIRRSRNSCAMGLVSCGIRPDRDAATDALDAEGGELAGLHLGEGLGRDAEADPGADLLEVDAERLLLGLREDHALDHLAERAALVHLAGAARLFGEAVEGLLKRRLVDDVALRIHLGRVLAVLGDHLAPAEDEVLVGIGFGHLDRERPRML